MEQIILSDVIFLLPRRQALVLLLRLQRMSFEEIGSMLGVTRERVRQIEFKGLDLMQEQYNKYELERIEQRKGVIL